MPVSFQMEIEGIRSTKPTYQTSEESGNNNRKTKDEGNGKTAKRSGRNTTNSSSKKKGEEEVRSLYNEGYYTDNINSDSLHQESEYNDVTDDDIYQKNKKKKTNKKDDWSDKALEDFLETLREQPVKEMNDRCNKWIMFSKRLKKKAPKKPMMTVGNRYLQSIVNKIKLFKFKMVIIVNHCYLMYFQYAKMIRIFQKYTRQMGAPGNISPINKRIINVFSAFKHVEADIVGYSSGSGILNSGKKITATKLLLFVRSTLVLSVVFQSMHVSICGTPLWSCDIRNRLRRDEFFSLNITF